MGIPYTVAFAVVGFPAGLSGYRRWATADDNDNDTSAKKEPPNPGYEEEKPCRSNGPSRRCLDWRAFPREIKSKETIKHGGASAYECTQATDVFGDKGHRKSRIRANGCRSYRQ